MGLSDLIEANLSEAVYNTDGFGKSATHFSIATSGSTAVTVVVDYDADIGGDGKYATIHLQKSDLASMESGDTITIDSDVWTLIEDPPHNGYEWICRCERDVRVYPR